ncbi:hypothetical protein L195_g023637 [Trifolium pratense]|uniref:Uncharacterized protein n=1 Tax=Trifolium pratense TaxID=57577 RepID=A0A2K3NBE5_TRIPR|nr:hypothetical protein L195_g023637 [Trifolium pratense]
MSWFSVPTALPCSSAAAMNSDSHRLPPTSQLQPTSFTLWKISTPKHDEIPNRISHNPLCRSITPPPPFILLHSLISNHNPSNPPQSKNYNRSTVVLCISKVWNNFISLTVPMY